MGRRRRTTESQSEGGHDNNGSLRWLLTYADMITLLMAFFIMMYSMSILNLNKFRQVALSIRSGFGGMAYAQGRTIVGTSGKYTVRPDEFNGDVVDMPTQAIEKIQRLINEKNLQKSVRLRVDERGLVVSLVSDKVLFARGDAELLTESQKLIYGLAGILKSIPNHVRVEGHTCNLPISSAKFPSNWELSTARASTVVRCMIEQIGISADRLSAAGYADSKPIAPNDNEKNRALNRRVDIVILNAGKA